MNVQFESLLQFDSKRFKECGGAKVDDDGEVFALHIRYEFYFSG